jgi:hypothetical protein
VSASAFYPKFPAFKTRNSGNPFRFLVLGIVPLNRICVTPRASLGFHTAYFDKSFTFGIKVTNYWATADILAYYPETVKKWIVRS